MSRHKQTKSRKQIKRQTRHFQLRTEHPQDSHVAEILDYAKSQRRQVTLIRDAIALFYALEQGDMSLLLEKFPFVGAALAKPEPAPPGGAGGNDAIAAEIQRLRELIMSQGANIPAPPDGYPVMKSLTSGAGQSGPKPLAAPKLALPVFEEDDDQDTVIIRKSENISSAANFVAMMQSFNQ